MVIDKKILSIDLDDDNENYKEFFEYLVDDTKRKKKKSASEIEEIGELCLKEIDRKNKNKELMANKLIPYIIKHCNNKYGEEELKSYSFDDVQNIYKEIKIKRRPIIIKFFQFIFNL
jgi:hypothetical protein